LSLAGIPVDNDTGHHATRLPKTANDVILGDPGGPAAASD